MTTRVVHVNDHIEGAVYIGRAVPRRKLEGSPFANPHKVKGDRQLAIDMFEIDITEGPLRPLLADLPALRGKPLACWCRHDGQEWMAETWCHGDVLVGLLEGNTDEELRAMAAAQIPLHWCQTCNAPMNASRFADEVDEDGFHIWESYCTRCDPPLFDDRACRICGCTDDLACEGRCYWVEWDLCSECAKRQGIQPAEPEWRTRQRIADHEDRLSEVEQVIDELLAERADRA